MEFIPLQPPRIGLKVYFHAPEGGRPTSGVYTVVDTSEYAMAGHVVVETGAGHRYGVNAEQLDILEWLPVFHAVQTPAQADGLTFLPSASVLTSHGFTEGPKKWSYRSEVLPIIDFGLVIAKTPVAEVLGEPLYGYRVSLSGRNPALLTPKDSRELVSNISELLETFLPLTLRIEVPLHALGWKAWPEHRPLIGMASDHATLRALA